MNNYIDYIRTLEPGRELTTMVQGDSKTVDDRHEGKGKVGMGGEATHTRIQNGFTLYVRHQNRV